MIKHFFVGLFLSISQFALAESDKALKLEQQIKNHQVEDSLLASYYNDLGFEYVYNKPDTALIFINEGFRISKLIGEKHLQGQSLVRKGIVYDIKSKWDSSLYFYNLAIRISSEAKDEKILASATNNKGLIYWKKGDYDSAVYFYEKSLKLFEILENFGGIANTMNNLAIILQEQNRFEEAIEKHHLVKIKYQELGNKYGISASLSNIGLCYELMDQLDSARYYLGKVKIIKTAINDTYGLAINATNLSEVFEKEEQFDSAIHYAKIAVELHSQLGNSYLEAGNLSALGGLYLKTKDYSSCKTVLEKAYKISLDIEAQKVEFGINERYANLYEALGNYPKAYYHTQNAFRLYVQIYSSEKDKKIAEVLEKYESEKGKKELVVQKKIAAEAELKNEQNRVQLIVIFSLFIILLLIAALYYSYSRNKQKSLLKQMELQQAASINKVQSEKLRISRDLHDNIGSQLTFVVSALDHLNYIEDENKRKEKIVQVETFAQNTMRELRETVWAMKLDNISIQDFNAKVADLFQQAKLASPNTKFKIEQSPFEYTLKSNEAINLYRGIQEAINNAIKYAKSTTITYKSEPYLLSVIDDGSGFDTEATTYGNGLQSIHNRMDEIGFESKIESKIGEGTSIHFIIPKNNT